MRIYNNRINWYQRIASLMIVVILISSLTCNVPTVYAAEEVAEPFSINYTEEEYSVTAEVAEVWNTGYNIRITINNTSDETIHNWGILFETKDEIHDLYNAQELSNEDGIHLLRNSVYNQDIPAGESVTFGYTGYYTEEMDIPEEYAVSSIETAVEIDGFLVSYILCDSWDSGAIAQILIQNTSDKTIEDWILEFDSKIEITKIWDAELVSHEGEHYVIRNVPYAHNIMAGSTAVAGLHLLEAPETDEDEDILTNIIVREILPDGSGQGNGNGDENNPSVSDNDTPGEGEEDDDVSGNIVPDEDIVHLEMEEGLGEIYFKTAYSDDVVSDPDGLPCIKNQFLLSADDTVDFWYVENYLSELGVEIVGYIEAINNYQVEMIEDADVYAIQELTERISNEAWVDYAGFNYLWLEEPCFTVSDPWSEDPADDEEKFDTIFPEGSNWGLEAIDFVDALIYAGVIKDSQALANDIVTDHLTTVRMGIIDSAFDEDHKDINFAMTWLNYRSQDELVSACNDAAEEKDADRIAHGTHVAGTMCAGFNNGAGISGICIKNELYGVAMMTDYTEELNNKHERVEDTTFYAACGLAVLIFNDVKVINYSMGLDDGMVYAASLGEDAGEGYSKVIEYLDKQSSYIEDVLVTFLDLGYDFLIVTAAGNGNDDTYYQCNTKYSYIGGYISEIDANKENNDRTLGVIRNVSYNTDGMIMDAKYNDVFSYIPESSPCYDHIICVGSVKFNEDSHSYEISSFSNIGSRVDIYAPGEDIYSTYITGCASYSNYASDGDYSYVGMSGTSMAAPHVSGTAGLAYNVDPDLNAAELKQIIINNAEIKNDIRILNAGNVIAEIAATVKLHVTDAQGNDASNAEIEIREYYSYYFMIGGGVMILPGIGGNVIARNITTDQSGIANLYLQWGKYFVLIKDEYNDQGTVYYLPVYSDNIEGQPVYEVILNPFNNNKTHFMILQFKDAETHSNLDDITVVFYKGWDEDEEIYRTDEGIASFSTDGSGNIYIQAMPEGAYTVEIYRNGVAVGYSRIIVDGTGDATYYTYQL